MNRYSPATRGASFVRCAVALAIVASAVSAPNAAWAGTKAQLKASALSEQGTKFYLGGQFGAAEALFREAYKLDPVPGYRYSAARAAHKGGKLKVALADYNHVIDKYPESGMVVKAKFHREAVQKALAARGPAKPTAPVAVAKPEPVATPEPAKPAPVAKLAPAKPAPVAKPAPAKPAPAKPAPVVKPAPVTNPDAPAKAAAASKPTSIVKPAATPTPVVTYAALGVGVIGLATAGVFAASWKSGKDAYDAKYDDKEGVYIGEHDALQKEVEAFNNDLIVAYIAGGVGAVAAGFGVYKLLTAGEPGSNDSSETTMTLIPQRNGASLLVRF